MIGWINRNWIYLLVGGVIMAATTAATIKYIFPFIGNFKVGSGFGYRIHPITKLKAFHNGVDIGMPIGTSIVSPSAGKVVYVGKNDIGGNQLKIHHEGISTGYAHLDKILVKVGDAVTTGQVVAKSGNTGRSTGPHLHFTVRKNKPDGTEGDLVDPMLFFNFQKK